MYYRSFYADGDCIVNSCLIKHTTMLITQLYSSAIITICINNGHIQCTYLHICIFTGWHPIQSR